MENGFENSPMAKLIREYGLQDIEAQGLSTETKVQLIVEVQELGAEMIIDRGSERPAGLPRYHLAPKDLDRVRSTVTELQIFLQQAARLIEERQKHFLVDPGDTLLPILEGTSSLGQMNAAWKALRLRVELGTKAWTKYIAEYRQDPDDNLILSPLSTLPELYDDLDRIDDADQKLRYLFTNVPHHQQQLTEEGKTSLQRARSSWVHVLPMPAGIRNAFRLNDKPTPKPTPTLPATDLPTTLVSKGKARERDETLTAPSIPSKSKEVSGSKPDVPPVRSQNIWMGLDTPFKSANAWFVEPGRSNRSRQEGTSSQRTLTQDILQGIATPQPTLPEIEPTPWGGRETPPHMTRTGRQPRNMGLTSTSTRIADENARQQESHQSLHQPASQNPTMAHQTAEGTPPDDGDDGDSSSTHKSHRSRRRGRRSHTPRPRR